MKSSAYSTTIADMQRRADEAKENAMCDQIQLENIQESFSQTSEDEDGVTLDEGQ